MSELQKMKAVQEKSQAIGDFIEWLNGEKKIYLAKYITEETRDNLDGEAEYLATWPIPNIEKLLAEFFNIDLQKAEQEKRQLLEDIRGTKVV